LQLRRPVSGSRKVIRQRLDALFATGAVSGGAVYRLRFRDALTTSIACATAEDYAARGIPFDNRFDLETADLLYCTEMVLRAYRRAGVDRRSR
jgi:hypothetical protein